MNEMRTRCQHAFSLLEVMVAMAILAMAVSTLLVVRNNAIQQATTSVDIRRTQMLLQLQMGKIVAGLATHGSGDFRSAGYQHYRWRKTEQEAPLIVSGRDGKQYQIMMKRITLVLENSSTGQKLQQLSGYFPVKNPEDEEREQEKEEESATQNDNNQDNTKNN